MIFFFNSMSLDHDLVGRAWNWFTYWDEQTISLFIVSRSYQSNSSRKLNNYRCCCRHRKSKSYVLLSYFRLRQDKNQCTIFRLTVIFSINFPVVLWSISLNSMFIFFVTHLKIEIKIQVMNISGMQVYLSKQKYKMI